MKKLFPILLLFICNEVVAQGYIPSKHIGVNDAIFSAQKTPPTGRTMYFDTTLFLYRDFKDTSEVRLNLPTTVARFGHEFISVHQGGTLNSNGSFTGGISTLWWYRNGTADSNLVKVYVDSVKVLNGIVYLKRLTDSTFFGARADSTRDTILIRGTAAGGINSLVLNTPVSIFSNPVTFSNTGGAWSGTLNTVTQSSGTFWAGPASGIPNNPTFRTITTSDLPTGIPNGNLANSTINLFLGNSGTVPAFGASTVALGGTLTFNLPPASASTSGYLTQSDWNRFNSAASALVTSVNGQTGAVVILNADSLGAYPIDFTNFRNNYVLSLDTAHSKLVFNPPGSGSGIISLNGLVTATQTFSIGSSGTGFNISSISSTHTFNIPYSSSVDTGLVKPADWITFNSKEPAITAPNTPNKYWNGYKQFVGLNTDSITEGSTNLFFTTSRARVALSAASPILYNNSTGVISEQVANTSQSGYLTSTDWNTFNGKQAAGNYITGITGDVVATGPGSVSATIQTNAVTTAKINNNAVTYGKIQASSQAALLGATTAGNYGEIPLGAGLAFSGGALVTTGGSFTNPMTTNGDMIYQVGGTYGRLAVAGHAGMKLTSGASGAIAWEDTTAGGTGVTSVGLALPTSLFSISGSPVTSTGTLTGTFNTQNAGFALISDSVNNGQVPTMRHLVVKDLPASRTWPAPTNYGDIYNKIYWNTNDLNNILVNASGGTASSVTVNASNQLVSTASGASFTNYNYIYPNMGSMLNHWVDTTDFTVTAFGNGYASCFVGSPQGITAYLTTTSGASTLNIANNGGSTFYRSGITGPTMTLNHTYETILSLNDSVVTFSAQDLTTGGTVFSTTYTLAIAAGQVPNFGHFGFFSFTGTHAISKLHINSTSSRNANLCFIVDSKGEEYTPTSFAGRWPAQVGVNYPPYNLYGGSSSTIVNVLSCMDQLTTINAEQYLMADEGRNDLHAGVALSIIAANITKAFNALSSGGAKVWLTIMPEDSTGGGQSGLTALKNWMAAAYPNNYIDLWTGMTTGGNNILKAAYNSGDGIHPNQAGHNFIATTINGLGILFPLDPSRLTQYVANDGNVKFLGDSLFLEFQVAKRQNFAAIWNSDGNLGFGVLQDNGTQAGVSSPNTNFTPLGNLLLTVDGGLGISGSSGGITFTDRSSTSTPEYGLYASGNKFNINASATSKDIIRTDSLGRIILNLVNSSIGSKTLHQAFIEIGSSNGSLGNIPLIIDSGSLVGTPVSGAIENNGSNLFWTDHLLTRDTLADRAWVRSVLPTVAGTNIGSTQNATSYSLTSSTGTGTTLNTATTTLAGLLDTARAKFVDSLRGGTKTFSLFAANGLTAAGGDSIYWGGTLNQATTVNSGGFNLTLGSNGTPFPAFTLYGTVVKFTTGGSGQAITLNGPINELASTTATDANYSSAADNIIILSSTITANRTITLPSASATASIGRPITIINQSTTTSFSWSFASAVTDASGNTITAIPNGSVSFLQSDGTNWRLLDYYNSLGGKLKYQHTIFTPTTGATVALINNQYNIINPSGALATLTVNLPSSPSNNDVVYIKYTQTVSAVTYGNGTVVAPITAPVAGGLVVLTYDSNSTSWY